MTDFAWTKSQFQLPAGVVYLDGNSLGPLARKVVPAVDSMIRDEWGEMLIGGWNRAGWIEQPTRIGERIGRLIGAEKDSVVMGDTLSIKIYQALASALELRPDRKVVLSDDGNFPSDLYMADGLLRTLDKGHRLVTPGPEDVFDAIDESVAVVMLTHVDYRTGRMHDMARLTQKAHEAGALVIWDLAHSAGAVPVNLAVCGADFAAGCTYKYLNGGPGAPAFIYVSPKHADKVRPALSGWLGHESPFSFDSDYRAGRGIERMRVGTPPIIQMTALAAALDVWDNVDMNDLRAKSLELSEMFISMVSQYCPGLVLASPQDGAERGSQVSFRFRHGYAMMQALIDNGVVGDFREPDIMRFGIAPLYIDESDIETAAGKMKLIVENSIWRESRYRVRALVT